MRIANLPSEIMPGLLAALVGLLLGLLFFYGLWWTIERAMNAKRPALWFMVSLLLRLGTTVLGFYLVADGQWSRLLWCCGGFVCARRLMRRRLGLAAEEEGSCRRLCN